MKFHFTNIVIITALLPIAQQVMAVESIKQTTHFQQVQNT